MPMRASNEYPPAVASSPVASTVLNSVAGDVPSGAGVKSITSRSSTADSSAAVMAREAGACVSGVLTVILSAMESAPAGAGASAAASREQPAAAVMSIAVSVYMMACFICGGYLSVTSYSVTCQPLMLTATSRRSSPGVMRK